MTTPTATIVAAPRFASMRTFDCTACGHADLGRTVWVSVDGGTGLPYGTGCAAKLIYGTARKAAAVRNSADAADTKQANIVRTAMDDLAWYVAAFDAWQKWVADPDRGDPGDQVNSFLSNYHGRKRAGILAADVTVRAFAADHIAHLSTIVNGG